MREHIDNSLVNGTPSDTAACIAAESIHETNDTPAWTRFDPADLEQLTDEAVSIASDYDKLPDEKKQMIDRMVKVAREVHPQSSDIVKRSRIINIAGTEFDALPLAKYLAESLHWLSVLENRGECISDGVQEKLSLLLCAFLDSTESAA